MTRVKAVEMLGAFKIPRVVESLILALSDRYFGVRLAAVRSLAKINDKRCVEPLSKLIDDDFASVRQAAILALSNLGDERAKMACIRSLKDDNLGVRDAAVQCLSSLSSSESRQALSEYYQLRQEEETRAREAEEKSAREQAFRQAKEKSLAALRTLGLDRDPTVIDTLLNGVEDPWKEAGVIEFTYKMQHQAWVTLKRSFGYEEVRLCVWALAAVADPRAITALRGLLARQDLYWCETAAEVLEALGWSPETRTEEALFAVASRKWYLAGTLAPEAIVPLVGCLKYGELAAGVSSALIRIGPSAAMAVAGVLGDAAWVRKSAVAVLAEIGDSVSVRPLVDQAIKWRDTSRASLEALESIFKRSSNDLTEEALCALAELPDEVVEVAYGIDDCPYYSGLDCRHIKSMAQEVLSGRKRVEKERQA